MSETNTDEHVLLQNENNDQFKISNKSNKQIKTEKEDESLDINDQNILDYDDDDGNSTNNKMNLKEKAREKNEENDEESDGEIKTDPSSDNELDDGEVSSPKNRFESKTSYNNEQKIQIKEESEKEEEEDGEINDGEKTKKAFVPRVLCKYYQRGKCTWGRGCKFLHPGVNDTGNYSFLEFQDPNAKVFQQQSDYSAIPNEQSNRPTGSNGANDAQTESAWERGLRHAKEMKEKALKRKQTEGDQFADKKMNLSLKEFENEKENDERYVNVEKMATVDDDLNDEDLSQFAKWRQNNPQSSNQRNIQRQSNRYDSNNDSKYNQYQRSKRASISPERDNKYANKSKADQWHDPWERSRQSNKKSIKDNTKREKSSNYSSSDSDSKSRSRSASRSSYSSKSSDSYRSSSKSYSSRSNSRSPNRNKKNKANIDKSNDSKKTYQMNKKSDTNKNLNTKPLPGRQISDFSLKKAKHGKTRSRSNSSTSSYDSSKSNEENESDEDDDSKDGSFTDDDEDEKSKKNKSKSNISLKKQLTGAKGSLKRAAQDSKIMIDAKKLKTSAAGTSLGEKSTDKKQMIKDQLKLLESALKKKTSAK